MNYSFITDHIFIGTPPKSASYPSLRALGVQLVINMCWEWRPRRDPHPDPMPSLWLPCFDSPFIPIPLRNLQKGVRAALDTITTGGKVYIHCARGIHRSVAMGAAVLIAQMYTPQEAMQLIKERRAIADPHAWYIQRQILKFAHFWNTTGLNNDPAGG